MEFFPSLYRKISLVMLVIGSCVLAGCYEDPIAFDEDGILKARITRTEFGVPHVMAGNLESLSFGVGYAYAEDNLCLLADQIIRFNSQRSRYFGPDQNPGSGDSLNLINDFSYKALEIRSEAEAGFPSLSDGVRAMLSGYTKGYNHYLETAPTKQQDPRCAGQAWLKPIDELDLLTYSLGVALLPGAGQFTAPIFIAAPPGESFSPEMAATGPGSVERFQLSKLDPDQVGLPEKNPMALGSNGWALGKDKTENQQGMLLANPHFPHTGNLRFWQFHSTIPGSMDVMGASLTGMPGIINIGFTHEMAWTHTFSFAEHFIVYRLSLDEADPSGMTYTVDGENKTIERRSLTIDVAVEPGTVLPFTKDVFFSDFGPVIVVPGKLPWGSDASGQFSAFSIKDANKNNLDILEHWLALNLARDMEDFQQAFIDFDGMIFNNTMAVDRNGNTFYVDDSAVPHLSDYAEMALTTDPTLIALREQAGFTILPGHSSIFDFNESVPYEKVPKLSRNDFVQNSNDSYWLTNPSEPLTGYSTLYGKVNNPQTLRSRMGQKLLQDAAGENQRFSLQELEQEALLSNRNYLGEAILEDVLILCESQGSTPVIIDSGAVNLVSGCQALAQWDGLMNLDSRGAHLFREFAEAFDRQPQWLNEFNPDDPVNTPSGLKAGQTVLEHLASAMVKIEAAGLPLDATLGEVQFVERSQLDGSPTGHKLPWAGANNIEGGFNVFRANLENDGTLLPRHRYPPLEGSQISAVGEGYHITYGSSWMLAMEYTRRGPKARGLLSFSQATNPASPYYVDQTEHYSEQVSLRPIWFEHHEIQQHAQSQKWVLRDIR
ncbi:acylase [Hahella ganghwensis]|uniref:acylase n=1 Tax=Hahella ganghwensis TaxID=286420 RepID=UPI000377ACC9|nr:acylase [Hahella ganghwensis]